MKIDDGKREVQALKAKIEKTTKDIEASLKELNVEYTKFDDERKALISELELVKKTVRSIILREYHDYSRFICRLMNIPLEHLISCSANANNRLVSGKRWPVNRTRHKLWRLYLALNMIS